jgi:hypothetical protein
VSDGYCAHWQASQAHADANKRHGDVEVPERLNLADDHIVATHQQQAAQTDTIQQIASQGVVNPHITAPMEGPAPIAARDKPNSSSRGSIRALKPYSGEALATSMIMAAAMATHQP